VTITLDFQAYRLALLHFLGELLLGRSQCHSPSAARPVLEEHRRAPNPGAETQVLRDIDTGHLPAMSWVIPAGQESDRAGVRMVLGLFWVAAIVNAVEKSCYWPHTAIFIT
jgi:phospholipase C